MYQIDNTLYDAFGQRSVSTIYNALNQYHVVMEVAPRYWQRPSILRQIWVSTSGRAGERVADQPTERGLGHPGGSPRGRDRFRRVDAGRHAVAVERGGFGGQPDIRLASNAVPLANNVVPLAADQPRAQQRQQRIQRSAASNNAVRTAAQATITSTGNGSASSASPVSTSAETMTPLPAYRQYGPGNTPLAVNHQSAVRGDDNLFQSRAGKVAERRGGRISARSAGRSTCRRPYRRLCRRRARI